MKKLLIFLLLAIIPLTATAQNISANSLAKLTNKERILVLDMIEKNKQNIPMPTTTKEVEKWANIGSAVGKALSESAKGLGIAVNDFAKTDVGFLATVLIFWHFIGATLVHIFGGILILVVGTIFIHYIMRNGREYEYKTIEGKEKKLYKPLDADQQLGYLASFAIIIAISLTTIFTF